MTNRDRRDRKGAALLSVLIMGSVGMLFLLALASIVTSSVAVSSSNKWSEGLRNCAEIGVDYAVDQFNSTYPCALDPTAGNSLTTQLPSSELQAAQTNGITPVPGVANVTVMITVRRLALTDWNWLQAYGSLYSPQLDPNNSVTTKWDNPASTNLTALSGGGFRVVESTASNGLMSRTIRVILKARFAAQPDGTRPLQALGSTPTQNNYFSQPFFGNQKININNTGNSLIAGTPGATGSTHPDQSGKFAIYNLQLATNSQANISSGLVSGDVVAAAQGAGTNQVVSLLPTAAVEGRVLAGGSAPSDPTFALAESRADSPNGVYDPNMTRLFDNNTNIVGNDASLSQTQISPVATPASATTLSDLSNYTGANSPVSYTHSTVFQTQSLSTDSIPAGESVFFDNSSSAVQIFINQGVTDQNAVNIDTSKISTNSVNSADFQIWYEGSKNVNITLNQNFNGLIYAPNATVTIQNSSGLSTNPTFKGGIVGNIVNVNLNSGQMSIDTGLGGATPSANGAGGIGGGGGAADSSTFGFYTRSGMGTVVQGWQPLTWQELGSNL